MWRDHGALFKLGHEKIDHVHQGLEERRLDECLVNSVDLAGVTIIESNIKGAIKTQADELPAGMFAGAKALKKVVLPSGLKSIGKEAFQTCESLPEIIIPSGVKTIANEAFEDCKSITKMQLPDGLTAIAPQLFND